MLHVGHHWEDIFMITCGMSKNMSNKKIWQNQESVETNEKDVKSVYNVL